MEYVQFCTPTNSECRRFSRLVMGTDHLAAGEWVSSTQSKPEEHQIHAVWDEAARQGINLFDSSPIYVGGVEYMLGNWRASRQELAVQNNFYDVPSLNPDRRLYALSKGGFPIDLHNSRELPAGCHSIELINALKMRGILEATAENWQTDSQELVAVPPGTYASRLYCNKEIMVERISQELEKSRENLKCHIELYLMHRDDGDTIDFEAIKRPNTPVQRILEAVSSPEIANQFFMLGWSNWRSDRVNESLSLANRLGDLTRPMINSPYFSLFEMSDRTIHALGVQVTHSEMMDSNFQRGITIMPYSPLGGFSILDQPTSQWEHAKKAAWTKYLAKDPYWMNVFHSIFTEVNEARWHRAVRFTEDFNRKHRTKYTVDQILNAYVLAHPRTDMLVIGAINVEQVRRTVQALKLSKMLSVPDLDHLYSGKVKPSLGSVDVLH